MKGSIVLVVGDAGVARAVLAPRVTSEGLRQWCSRLCGYIPPRWRWLRCGRDHGRERERMEG